MAVCRLVSSLLLVSLGFAVFDRSTASDEAFCRRGCGDDRGREAVTIPGGEYFIGTTKPVFEADGEGPERRVFVNAFQMDVHEVSNRDFEAFIHATGHITEAERFGHSFVLLSLIKNEDVLSSLSNAVAGSPWWVPVNGSTWKVPEGKGSGIRERMDHPVVHVSWNDAKAFCAHKGKRLPTEQEWEVACRGGLRDRVYAWGNKWMPNGEYRANTWQGSFPTHDSGLDGYVGTAPVNAFAGNPFGLKHILGNVWEWTEDNWSVSGQTIAGEKVKKGGSFMCHHDFCFRYRCAARSHNTPDSSASNLGFRCARSLPHA